MAVDFVIGTVRHYGRTEVDPVGPEIDVPKDVGTLEGCTVSRTVYRPQSLLLPHPNSPSSEMRDVTNCTCSYLPVPRMLNKSLPSLFSLHTLMCLYVYVYLLLPIPFIPFYGCHPFGVVSYTSTRDVSEMRTLKRPSNFNKGLFSKEKQFFFFLLSNRSLPSFI